MPNIIMVLTDDIGWGTLGAYGGGKVVGSPTPNLDKNGEYMDGAKTYKLNIPADVPAKDFWSIVAYDSQTRSQLQTNQPFLEKNNQRHKLDVNEDGSVDLYFAPEAPKGKEAN